MNKKGFELSINFIVMLILATVVFGFGLYFVRMLFTEAGEIKAQLDRDSEARINLMLDRGEMVAFPISTKTIKQNEVAVFGLGVLNVKDDAVNFKVTVECSLALDKADNPIDECGGKWSFDKEPLTPDIFDVAVFSLMKNEKQVIPIAIQPPKGKPVGTYAFTVKVIDTAVSGEIYSGSPKQIYVNID